MKTLFVSDARKMTVIVHNGDINEKNIFNLLDASDKT